MYANTNFKTKKALKEAVASGQKIGTHQAGGLFAPVIDGSVCLEGPHYPQPHRWYATAVLKDGIIQSVK